MAGTPAEYSFQGLSVFIDHCLRNEGLDRTGKTSAMDAASPFIPKNTTAQHESQRYLLDLRCSRTIQVLKKTFGGSSGFID